MAKETAVPTDTRDKVGAPDPGMDFLALLLGAGRNAKNANPLLRFMTDSSDAEKRFSPHLNGGAFFWCH